MLRLPPFFDYGTDDLMARHERELGLGQFSVDHMQVGSTNSTGLHSNQDLFSIVPGNRQFLLAERVLSRMKNKSPHVSLNRWVHVLGRAVGWRAAQATAP